MGQYGFGELKTSWGSKVQWVVCILLLAVTQYAAAYPKAGSQITNIASGDFVDEQGNLQVINSNPVSLTVQPVYALTLISNQQTVGTIGSKLDFPHFLTNTGNIVGQYDFSLNQLSSDQFDLSDMALYVDRDQDGIPDDNINLLASGNLRLEAGESVALVVVGNIPATVSAGNTADFSLTATSVESGSVSASVTDSARVVDDAVIQVTKSQSISIGKVGTQISYTLTYRNTGTAARKLLVQDVLPADVSYQANSATWSNGSGVLTDANDGSESGANAAIDYRVLPSGEVEFEVASVAALSTGAVSFNVIVNADAGEKIINTANYKQYDAGNSAIKETNTNTVVFTVQHELGVVANTQSASAVDGGDPDANPDNLQILNNVEAGQEAVFTNYVWNVGQTADIYNLSTVATNLPSCAVVRLYHSDGRTLLTDSNADGVIDTGSLSPEAAKEIKVGVFFPSDCTYSGTITVDLTATSVTNRQIDNSVRNQIVNSVVTGESDLYNSDNSGVGVANVDDAGDAWITQPIVKGGSTVFPLVISNTGALPNNYNLYASDATIDLNNINETLPTGWSVKFYEGDATCTTLGAQITNSGNVPAASTKQYCAVVSAPEDTTLSELPIWFAMKSDLNGQGDVIKDQVDVVLQRELSLVNDRQGQVSIGGTIVYLHTLENTGSFVEGDAAGDVSLSVSPQDVNDGWSYTLYFDANNNGELDSSDPVASDLFAITGAGLAPQESIQLLLKVQAPAQATNGVTSLANVVVTPTDTIQGLSLDVLTNTDRTTISASQLRLVKAQVRDETCTLTDVSTAIYVSTPIKVKPNQCVTYRLTVTNDSAEPATDVVINDTVPAFSELRNPPAPSITMGSVSVVDINIMGDVGTLAPQQEASLYFSIRVNP